jgi:hypothetical protein
VARELVGLAARHCGGGRRIRAVRDSGIGRAAGLPQNWLEPSRIVSLIVDTFFVAVARKYIGSHRDAMTVASRGLLLAVPSDVHAHLMPVSVLISNRVVWPAEIMTICGRSLLLSMPRRCSSTR